MWTSNSKYFGTQFKDKVKKEVSRVRSVFQNEMKDVTYLFFGDRFNSDDQCFQALCQILDMKFIGIKNPFDTGKQIERDFELDHGLFEQAIWQALKQAAECDHHYMYEKEWE